VHRLRSASPLLFCATVLVFCALAPLPAIAQDSPLDYPQWRGPDRDGSAAAFVEPEAWPEQLTRSWQVEVGTGYATPIVIGARVYTFTRQEGDEVLTAVDAATGRVVWSARYPAPYQPKEGTYGHGSGPKSTPLFKDGKLYTLGISGIVSAFDTGDGTLLWQLPEPPVDPIFATAMSPLADGDNVIFHVGGHDQGALTAFDATTGDVTWSWDGDGPAYGSPILADLGGTRQIVTVSQDHIVGVSAATGELLWQRPFDSLYTNNSITPIAYDDSIIMSGLNLGVTRFRPVQRGARWVTETIWQNQDLSLFMSNGVLVDDVFYSLAFTKKGQFFALDAVTGETLWATEGREAENTALVKAGSVLFLLNDDAELIVARASRDGFEPIRRYTVADSVTWAQPAISGNRLFVKDDSTLALWTVD
jgi:outer membrane protein assembly factor BamB